MKPFFLWLGIVTPPPGRAKLTEEQFADPDGVTVRLEDATRPEWWAEVRLSIDELRGLVAECDGIAADYSEHLAEHANDEYPTPEDFADRDLEPEPAVVPF